MNPVSIPQLAEFLRNFRNGEDQKLRPLVDVVWLGKYGETLLELTAPSARCPGEVSVRTRLSVRTPKGSGSEIQQALKAVIFEVDGEWRRGRRSSRFEARVDMTRPDWDVRIVKVIKAGIAKMHEVHAQKLEWNERHRKGDEATKAFAEALGVSQHKVVRNGSDYLPVAIRIEIQIDGDAETIAKKRAEIQKILDGGSKSATVTP